MPCHWCRLDCGHDDLTLHICPEEVLMGETLHRTRAPCQKATRVLENVWPLTHRTLLVCFDENHWARFLGIKLKSSVTIRPSQPHLSLYSLPLHTSLSQTHAQCSFQNSANKCLYLISSFSSCGLLNNSSCLWLWRELYKPRMRCLKKERLNGSNSACELLQGHWMVLAC